MTRREDLTLLISGILLALAALIVVTLEAQLSPLSTEDSPMTGLLTDPFLQRPTADSVRVVWFTEFAGQRRTVFYGQSAADELTGDSSSVPATTRQLSRLREDSASNLPTGTAPEEPTPRPIWRHEAEVTGLPPGQRFHYRVESVAADGTVMTSDVFSLAAAPAPNTPLQILLTSDHQSKPMTAANLQKVAETVGQVDAVFMARGFGQCARSRLGMV